jgi:hypothetical protein
MQLRAASPLQKTIDWWWGVGWRIALRALWVWAQNGEQQQDATEKRFITEKQNGKK